jgi:hypothetical protein
MRRHGFLVAVAVILLATSGILYLIHYLIFRDAHHIYIYLLGDFAFLPLQVLVVGLIIDRIFSWREKQAMLSKMNMVVGVFFSEMGTRLGTAARVRSASDHCSSWSQAQLECQ